MSERPDARSIAQMLASRVSALTAELLPAGHRDGQEWRCGSLAGERGQSLAVRLTGERAGVWCDFSTGDRGDALDLVAAVLYRGDKREALRWASRWLGTGNGVLPRPAQRRGRAAGDHEPDREVFERRRKALRLFLSGERSLIGTPAAAYLAGRGIDLAELGRQPAALRYHPEAWCSEAGRKLPALLAAITEPGGRHIATHRTWLAQDTAGIWRKAPLSNPKKSYGSYTGGIIPLWRGASGKPLRQAPQGEHAVIAEGIETALSVALAVPELRVIAAVSLGNMARIALPPTVTCLTIAADNDGDNPSATQALQRAIDRFIADGREVRIARSPIGKDMNDALRG